MNAADEKAWREYQKDLGPSGREGTMSAHIIKSALLAGRASRNSEVEAFEAVILAHRNLDNVLARNIPDHEPDTSQVDIRKARQQLDTAMRNAYDGFGLEIIKKHEPRQALTKGDSDAG